MKTEKIDLGTKTLEKLKAYIKDQNLQKGDKLPTEPELIKILGVGRSTVRESVKILAYSGVVEVKQGSGTYLTGEQTQSIDNIKLRHTEKMLEYEAIKELINNDITDQQWLSLKARLGRRNQLLEQGKFSDYLDADIKFHTMIIQLSQNEYLTKWYQQLQPLWKSYLSKLVVKSEEYRGNTELHNQLFEALINRNQETALKLIGQVGK
ncbi:FadR family transcriptional regulator [Lactobacillus sp. W8089]|nr:FadR family transcriptional regulator [Lactobacillus sp. W8086]MBI0109447.1 FadR family transcriptional regulator [Lactobacillus sp. W8085]MBI0112638.1 FadR family transcriptional regulator [Lactobacillus sp. W8088]MBI0116354.1 FadR family transcriptional regulator [Lactobacillus sp. W8087]MBI0120104.1 FadR family transcriptional regulator [Lactobacillus sp. W8089]MBI0132069.1 FadR family transcriptional regulator [Lactobacillus sp. W8090]MCT6890725.1 GntR family transcriptional regulator 